MVVAFRSHTLLSLDDRTSKFAVIRLVDKADRQTAWELLGHLLKAVPYLIHTILTDIGIQFAEQPRNRNSTWSGQMRFDIICEASGIEQRLTKPNRPWTNGQVEWMNRTIEEATVERFHYEDHDQLRTHLAAFMAVQRKAVEHAQQLFGISKRRACDRRIRVLVVVDDLTRENLAVKPDTSISGARVARQLDAIIAVRGKPLMIVSDNPALSEVEGGAELTSIPWC